MRDDVAPGQTGASLWWNDTRREENPDELDEVRAKARVCPTCEEQGMLWASVPYWCCQCDCGATLYYDEPEDAVDAFNKGEVRREG